MHKSALLLCILFILSACSKAPEHEFAEQAAAENTTEHAALQQDNNLLNSQSTTQDEQAHLADTVKQAMQAAILRAEEMEKSL